MMAMISRSEERLGKKKKRKRKRRLEKKYDMTHEFSTKGNRINVELMMKSRT